MARCIEIAKNGLGSTAPNPMVGAIIVHKDRIIGQGFTSAYGGAHAEVNAIHSVNDKTLLKAATLYVTLEPCSHFGKTAPCADLITKHMIPRVVIGTVDPHKKVAGNGIRKLKAAGCEVTVGVLEKECRGHHKRFFCFHEKKRPYIILKWAQTQDGFIAPEANKRSTVAMPFWITNTYSKQMVHQWRAEEQAVLVGTTTVLEDNPKLDVRNWKGKNPVRVVLDRQLKTPSQYHVMNTAAPTLILTEVDVVSKEQANIQYKILDFSQNLAQQICQVLFEQGITSVIIEGGTKTVQTFIDAYLWDEARIFTGSTYFNQGTKAPHMNGKLISKTTIQEDVLKIYTP